MKSAATVAAPPGAAAAADFAAPGVAVVAATAGAWTVAFAEAATGAAATAGNTRGLTVCCVAVWRSGGCGSEGYAAMSEERKKRRERIRHGLNHHQPVFSERKRKTGREIRQRWTHRTQTVRKLYANFRCTRNSRLCATSDGLVRRTQGSVTIRWLDRPLVRMCT